MHVALKLHAAVDAAIERLLGKEEARKHLGASLLGRECARQIWYGWRWTKREKFIARILRLFNRGHETEPRFFLWLREAGLEIHEAGESGAQKEQMRISFADGHGGGTPDAIARNVPSELFGLDEWVLVEAKTHNDKSFKKLIADGIMKTKWEHFVQMQLYMHGHGLKWALYCAINKNDDETRYEFVQYDEREARRALARGDMIVSSDEPPPRIGKNPSDFRCKFCHLSRLCFFGDVTPDRNCRSCKFSKPVSREMVANGFPAGGWYCSLHKSSLDEAAQRAGCSSYEVNPHLHQKT